MATNLPMHEEKGSSTRRIPTPSTAHHRALDISELLSHILSYALASPLTCISDAIDYDLGFSSKTARTRYQERLQILAVCRRWYQIGHRIGLRMLRWDQWTLPDAEWAKPLQYCHRLSCRFDDFHRGSSRAVIPIEGRERYGDDLIVCFAEHFDRAHLPWTKAQDTVVGGSSSFPSTQRSIPLKELCMTGDFDVHTHLYRLLSIPALRYNLTLVSLHFLNFREFDVTQFFERNDDDPEHVSDHPSEGHGTNDDSEVLHTGSSKVSFPLINLQHLLLFNMTMAPIAPSWRLKRPPRLRSLCLENVRAHQDRLLTFLKATSGPKMEHLRLFGVIMPSRGLRWRLNAEFSDLPAAIVEDAITVPCTHLRSIEVNDSMVLDTMTVLRRRLPRVETIRINDWVFHFSPLSPIRLVTNEPSLDSQLSLWSIWGPSAFLQPSERFLTRLDVENHHWDGYGPVLAFHRFLCSPQARHLKVLHAWNVLCRVQDLKQGQDRWVCEGLQVLAIGFYLDSGYHRRQQPNHGGDAGLIASRQTFGYLTSVLPNVRHVRLNASFLNIAQGAGGFCFTSRWRHLEALYIQADRTDLWGEGFEASSLLYVEEPRWMLSEPTAEDRFRCLDSLHYSRTIARMGHGAVSLQEAAAAREESMADTTGFDLDGDLTPLESKSCPGPCRRHSVVYPAEIDRLDKLEALGPLSPLDRAMIREGCCWSHLKSIHIGALVQFPPYELDLTPTLDVWRRLRPDVDFGIQLKPTNTL